MSEGKNVEEEIYSYVRSMEDEIVYKVIFLGDPAVGKTSLIKKYIDKNYEERYLPTIGVSITKKQVEYAGKKFTIMFWDIAGQPQFYLLHKVYYNGANGAVLIFDLTRSHTLMNLKNWYSELVKYQLQNIPIVIVGNKSDLQGKSVIEPQINHLAEQLGVSHTFMTSAKTGDNVEEIFKTIAELIYDQKHKPS
jgi:small GTP-binding protein